MFEGLVGRFDDWEVAGEPGWSAPGALVTVVSSLDHLPVRLR